MGGAIMKLEETKKLIDNIINNEFNHVQNENLKGMDDLKRYKKIEEETDEIQRKLYELLPSEHHHLVDEWESKETERDCIEIRHYFKKGVDCGTSNLNFLIDLTYGMKFY